MSKNAVTPTPINYTVLYEFFRFDDKYDPDANIKFMMSCDAAMNSNEGFNDVIGLKLYSTFIKSIPDNAQEIINQTSDLPESIQGFLGKAESYIAYHVDALLVTDKDEQEERLNSIRSMVDGLGQEIRSFKDTEKRIVNMIDRGLKSSYIDPFTNLFNERRANEDFSQFVKNKRSVFVLYMTFSGSREIAMQYGDHFNEALARYFARLTKDVIPGGFTLYRYSSEDGFLIMAYDVSSLDNLALKIEKAVLSKTLTHKFKGDNITEQIKFKYVVLDQGSNLPVLVRLARQRMR